MAFEIVGPILSIEPIAVNSSIRILAILQKRYGKGRWRKLKGVASVRLNNGTFTSQRYIGSKRTGLGRKR